jgi:4'-phosphopantetheinyl transferase
VRRDYEWRTELILGNRDKGIANRYHNDPLLAIGYWLFPILCILAKIMIEIRQLNPHLKLGLLRLDEFVKVHPVDSRRAAEKQGALYLLHELFPGMTPQLLYHTNGKPYVGGMEGGISVSHSHDLLAIIADSANTHTGLDVELIRDKVLKIRHKFLSEEEKKFIPEGNVMLHLVAWCAKETMYKIHSEGKVDFIGDLHIEKFTENDKEITASCSAKDFSFTKRLKIEQLNEYILSWPIN